VVVSAAKDEPPITLAPLSAGQEQDWARFLAASPNATLFHRLDFLAYHPKERFRFHHLLAQQNGKPVAAIPGGLIERDGRRVFASPVGASVGGPAVRPGARTGEILALVEALQDYAKAQGWNGIEITIPPAAYAPDIGEMLSFALFGRGFTLQHRWMCPMLPLRAGKTDQFADLFQSRVASRVRAARREGVVVRTFGVEGLQHFLRVLDDTYARHGVPPTHTHQEIADLLTRLPQDVFLVLALDGEEPLAGLLVMRLSGRVAYSFYICSSTAHLNRHGLRAAYATAMDELGQRGFAWLDLGPSAWDGNFNAGVTFFKEGMGAVGHNRDRWTWTC
jgi:hypothetical protein